MAYKLVYAKNVKKQVKKLDVVTRKKLGKRIKVYSKKPFFYGKKLTRKKLGMYRWRAGNYRIIFDVKGKTIQILKIGHRKEIYRKA